MSKKLLPILFVTLALAGNIEALSDTRTVANQIIRRMCVDKKLAAAIASLKEMIAEIENKRIRYGGSHTEHRWSGNTHYQTTTYYYHGEGDVLDVVKRYQKALDGVFTANMVLAAEDGVILGVLLSGIGKAFKLSDIPACSGVVAAAILWTLIKDENTDKVPYLDYRTLSRENNYFNIPTHIGTFLCTVGVGVACYFGSNFVMKAFSEKVSIIEDALSAQNIPS
jgi:hypothetical protein